MCSSDKSGRILLITNIPTPYRIPLFNELKEQLERKGLELKVVFGALGYSRRKWAVDMSQCKFEYEVLPSKNLYFSDSEKSSFTYPATRPVQPIPETTATLFISIPALVTPFIKAVTILPKPQEEHQICGILSIRRKFSIG